MMRQTSRTYYPMNAQNTVSHSSRTHLHAPRSAREVASYIQTRQPSSHISMLSPEYSDALNSRCSGAISSSASKGGSDDHLGKEINRALRAQKRAQQIATRSPLLPSPRHPSMGYAARPDAGRPRYDDQQYAQPPMPTSSGKHKRRVSFSRGEDGHGSLQQQRPRVVIRTAPIILSAKDKENKRLEIVYAGSRDRCYSRSRRATLPAPGRPSHQPSPMSSSSTLVGHTTETGRSRKPSRYSVGPGVTFPTNQVLEANKRLAPLSRFNPFSRRPRADSLSAVIDSGRGRRMSVDQTMHSTTGHCTQPQAVGFFSPFKQSRY